VGGIDVGKYGTLTMADSTVSGNSAQVVAGSQVATPGPVTSTDSTVSAHRHPRRKRDLGNYMYGAMTINRQHGVGATLPPKTEAGI